MNKTYYTRQCKRSILPLYLNKCSIRKTIEFKNSFYQQFREKLNLNTRELLNNNIWNKLFDTVDNKLTAWIGCEQKCYGNPVDKNYSVG
jgi:hypothetical protein